MCKTRLSEIVDRLSDLQQSQNFTGQPLIDTILRYKVIIAKESQVKIDIKGHFKQTVYLPDMDISIMLGNALDNAIEAAAQVTETTSLTDGLSGKFKCFVLFERVMHMKLNNVIDDLTIIIDNFLLLQIFTNMMK
jgi:hypothetical protein